MVGTCCHKEGCDGLFPAGTSEDDQASLRIKRSALRNDPTLWPDQRVPFVFEEPFRKLVSVTS